MHRVLRAFGLGVAAVMAIAFLAGSAEAAELILLRLECKKAQEITHPDEPYLKVNGKQVSSPTKMDKGAIRDLSSIPAISFDKKVKVELFEYDKPDPDDLLGEQIITSNQAGQGELTVVFNEDGALYELTYKVR
jgi:hypothetical protein